MGKMMGCAIIVTEEMHLKLGFGNVGYVENFLVQKTPDGYRALLLWGATINYCTPPLYFKPEDLRRKSFFEIQERFSEYGVSYNYESSVAQVATYIEDYCSETFNGENYTASRLKKMALSVLQVCPDIKRAREWIVRDENGVPGLKLESLLLESV